jgi:hypothetical protein
METNMRLHDFAHQAVDPAAHRGKQHQLAATVFVGIDQAFDSVELAAHPAYTLEELKFLAIMHGHGKATSLSRKYPPPV